MPTPRPRFVGAPLVRLALLCASLLGLAAPAARAATLLRHDFTSATWPALAGYSTSASGAVTATPLITAAGTIDAYGTNTRSHGLRLSVNSAAATGTWSAGVDSGVLDLLVPNSLAHPGLLTLAFSLSASSANPVVVRLESLDATGARSGGLKKVLYPAAPNFYQRFALDLSTFAPDGAGAFNPTHPKVRLFFEIGDTLDGAGWGPAPAHELRIDNVNYATPKYYVKNSSPGSDTANNGLTEATPFRTPGKALGIAVPGDIIVLMGQDTAADTFLGGINITKPAAPDAWIVLKNYPGHRPVLRHDMWNVINMGLGSAASPYTGTQVASYIEIRGLTVRGYSSLDANGDRTLPAAYQPFIGLVDGRTNTNGIGVDSRYSTLKSHNIRIADNVVEFNSGAGIGLCAADRVAIENNISRSNAWWMIYASSGISTLQNTNAEANNDYRSLYQNNQVYDNETLVPWIDITAFSDGNGIILDTHNDSAHTGRHLVQNNLVYGNGGNGISALGSDRVDIVHNTVYRNSASTRLQYSQISASYSADVRVLNNLVVAPANPTGTSAFNEPLVSSTSSGAGVLFQNNILHGEGNNTALPANATFADNLSAAPAFLSASLDPATNDFRLRAASPGLADARIIAYRRAADLDDHARPPAAAGTRGAYQTRPTDAFAPVFSPASGNYATAQNVALASDTAGATLIYTTDGTEPAVDASVKPTNGAVYSAPLAIASATTIKALAWRADLAPSHVSTARYTFNTATPAPLPAPTFYVPPTHQTGTRKVFLLTRTPGAYVRYTTDGSTPTETTGTLSAKDPITVASAATIKALAYKPGSGRAASSVSTNHYVVRQALGNRADGSGPEPLGANKIRLARFTAAGDLTATRVFARVVAVAGSYRAAIYAHNSTTGQPGALLRASAAVTAPATGWRSFALTSSLALTDDTTYWLALWSDDPAAALYRDTSGGTVREAIATFGATWPASPATAAAANPIFNYAIFATTGYAPLLDAGATQTLPSTAATATLAGAATTGGVPLPAGTLATAWSVFSGPGAVAFGNASALATTATFSAPGTYVLRLSGQDAYFPMFALTPADLTVTVLGLAPEPVPSGVVRARFTDGAGATSAQQFPGTAGDGWASAWATSSSAVNATLTAVAPLRPDTGNHLRVARTSGTSTQEGVYRQWSATTRPTTAFSRLTFDFRLDSPLSVFNAAEDTLNLVARSSAGAGTAPESSFSIRAYGAATGPLQAREWGVFNGTPGVADAFDIARLVPTGLLVQPGVTYTFTIDLYAASVAGTTDGKTHGTYDVTITDGATTVSVTGAGFRSASHAAGPYFTVATQQSAATDNLTVSFDSIELAALVPAAPPPLTVWRTNTFSAEDLADPALAATVWGDLADPDADGRANLLEYALGTDALLADAAPLALSQTSVDASTYLTVTIAKNPAATDVVFTAQASADLVTWSAAETVILTDTANTLIVRDAIPLNASAARRFLRLRISH